MYKTIYSKFLILFTAFLISTGASQQAQAELLDRIVAVVNDDIILQSEFAAEMRLVINRLRSQQTQLPPQAQVAQQVLEQMIVKKIQSQRAQKAGIRVSDQMINAALADIARRNGTSLNDLPAALQADGVDYASFRAEIREQLTLQQLSQREVGSNVRISESEVERLLAQGNSDQEYLVKHILIAIEEDSESDIILKKQTQIEKLRERLDQGEDFAKLAIAYSNGSQALKGGTLGWRNLSKLPSIFSGQVSKLNPGQISEVIRSPSGFHLIRVEDVRGNELPPQIVDQYQVRHILLRDSDLSSDSENKLKLEEIRNTIIAGKDFSEAARENSEDPGSATKGGDLGWSAVNVYDANFAKEIVSASPNIISAPFKSQFGWHILEVTGKRQQNMATEIMRNRARSALREQKFEEETLLWMQRLRDEAYVDYRL